MSVICKAALAILLAMTVLGVSCSSSTATTVSQSPTMTTIATVTTPPTTTPATTPAPTTTTAPATTSATSTYQVLAVTGATVFSTNCAVCHGATGQGITAPALWGTSATLGSYSGITLFANNAQAMLTWISANMPFSAPGNLSPASQYTAVLCYILTQGNKVSPSTVFDATQLGSITVN